MLQPIIRLESSSDARGCCRGPPHLGHARSPKGRPAPCVLIRTMTSTLLCFRGCFRWYRIDAGDHSTATVRETRRKRVGEVDQYHTDAYPCGPPSSLGSVTLSSSTLAFSQRRMRRRRPGSRTRCCTERSRHPSSQLSKTCRQYRLRDSADQPPGHPGMPGGQGRRRSTSGRPPHA
jgi:hypothetical protein